MQLKKIISATLLLGLLGSSAVFADVEPNPAETPNPTATDEQSYNSETEPTENTSDDTVPTDLGDFSWKINFQFCFFPIQQKIQYKKSCERFKRKSDTTGRNI